MKTFKKNQVIITALAIMIAVAGYISFTEKSNPDEDKYVFNNNNTSVDTGTEDVGVLVPNNEASNEQTEDQTEGQTDEQTEEVNPTEDAETVSEANLIIEDGEEAETVADNTNEDVGEAVLVSSNSVGISYFLEHKIKREQARAMSIEILKEVMNNENLGEEQKIQAATDMMNLHESIDKETASESMLEAKGFKDVFVRVNEETVDVVVGSSILSETESAQIIDVVSRTTNYDPVDIVISPLTIES